jgi:hypothetical protein
MAQSRTRRPVVAAGSGNNGGGGGSNIRMIVIAVAAVALGALVLAKGLPGSKTTKTTTSPGGSTASTKASKPGTVTTTTTLAGSTTAAPPTTTINLAASKIIVANGAEIDGIAGKVSTKLQERGYTTLKPTNTAKAAASVVYYLPGSEEIGKKVGADLAIAKVEAMPAAKPAEIGDAKVLVVIGPEFSEASIPAKVAPKPTTTTVAAPATAVTNPTTTKKP